MQLLLSKNVEGYNRDTKETRLHGKSGDVLFVLLESVKYYVCDSKYYANQAVIVFKTQVERIIKDAVSSNEEPTSADEYPIPRDIPIGDLTEAIEGESIMS